MGEVMRKKGAKIRGSYINKASKNKRKLYQQSQQKEEESYTNKPLKGRDSDCNSLMPIVCIFCLHLWMELSGSISSWILCILEQLVWNRSVWRIHYKNLFCIFVLCVFYGIQ